MKKFDILTKASRKLNKTTFRLQKHSPEILAVVGVVGTVASMIMACIVADPYAYQNCKDMVYVEIRGTKWKVSDIDMSQYPRLILSIGGVWNENTSGTSE